VREKRYEYNILVRKSVEIVGYEDFEMGGKKKDVVMSQDTFLVFGGHGYRQEGVK
jgi:hypothetical protein